MKRKEHNRRVRVTSLATAAISAGLAMILGPIALHAGTSGLNGPPSPPPSPSQSSNAVGSMTPWVQKLIDSPAHGDLAGDSDFRLALMTFVEELPYRRLEGSKFKLLFADDVGEFRVVIVAEYTASWQSGLFLVGPAGTQPESLTSEMQGVDLAFPALSMQAPLKPYASVRYRWRNGEVLNSADIGLAPAGCAIAVAAADGSWREQPGGSFAVRSDSFDPMRPPVWESARVTCDGVVRYSGSFSNLILPMASPPPPSPPPAGDEALAAARQGMIGEIPAGIERQLLVPCRSSYSLRIRYGGSLPGTPGNVYVATCRDSLGILLISVAYESVAAEGVLTYEQLTPPLDEQASVLGVRVGGRLLIIAPAAAVKVEVIDEGAAFHPVTTTNGIGSTIAVQRALLTAHAADGSVIGSGGVAVPYSSANLRPTNFPPSPPAVDNWR